MGMSSVFAVYAPVACVCLLYSVVIQLTSLCDAAACHEIFGKIKFPGGESQCLPKLFTPEVTGDGEGGGVHRYTQVSELIPFDSVEPRDTARLSNFKFEGNFEGRL